MKLSCYGRHLTAEAVKQSLSSTYINTAPAIPATPAVETLVTGSLGHVAITAVQHSWWG